MQDHVAKPFDLTELTNKILQHSNNLENIRLDKTNLIAETPITTALTTVQQYSTEKAANFNLTELADSINLLQSQLNSANMAALALFNTLQPSLQQLDSEITQKLAEEMASLAFVAAEKLLVKLKQILDRRINDQ